MATKYYEGQSAFREGLEAIDSPSPAGQKLRAAVGEKLVAHLRRMFQTIGLQIGYAYPDSPICVSDGTPPPVDDPGNYQPSTWPGARAPHVLLADGRSTLDLFGKGFVLLRLGSEPVPAQNSECRRNSSISLAFRVLSKDRWRRCRCRLSRPNATLNLRNYTYLGIQYSGIHS